MPKPKRFENFQSSIQLAPTSQGVAQPLSTTQYIPSHFDDPLQMASFIQPTARPTPSGHVAANSIQSDQTTTQQVPSVRAASQHPPSRKRSGRVSMQHWTVAAIDSQGASKILKVKKSDVLNLSNGQRIVVDFDDMDSPIGEGQGVLAGFWGFLATDSPFFQFTLRNGQIYL